MLSARGRRGRAMGAALPLRPSRRRALAGVALAAAARGRDVDARRRGPGRLGQGPAGSGCSTCSTSESAWSVTEGANVTVAVIDSGVNPDVSDLAGAVITGSDFTGLSTSTATRTGGSTGPGWRRSSPGAARRLRRRHHRRRARGEDPLHPGDTGQERPGLPALRQRARGADPAMACRGDHGRRPASRPGDQHVDRLLGAERRGPRRAAVRLRPRHRPGGVVRQLGRQRRAAHPHGITASRRCRSPPSTRACSAWARSTWTSSRRRSRAATSRSRSPRPACAVPAQGRNGLYWTVDGTSPACALVAGVAALIKSKYPAISPALVTEALTTTAQQPAVGRATTC